MPSEESRYPDSVSTLGTRLVKGKEKLTLHHRIRCSLPKSKPKVIIGIMLVIIGLLLLFLRTTTVDDSPDIEVAYVGSILLVGVAMVFL